LDGSRSAQDWSILVASREGPVRRGFETASKVVLGVVAAGVSVGVMPAEVILL